MGLKAYYVDVTEDCRGIKVAHGCAAVFIAGRPIFVDLTYSSFDITHRKFSVLRPQEFTCPGWRIFVCANWPQNSRRIYPLSTGP
ncbi:MAG: hypothetical protein AUI36_29130 [Cyanobacteria bacterium 13_1_40CM_2_61_4]|nr:MAG: hypothetical protein AUI36_29130 [Cyanobacteria bacterium 13_1_40CM_2_61_4]